MNVKNNGGRKSKRRIEKKNGFKKEKKRFNENEKVAKEEHTEGEEGGKRA